MNNYIILSEKEASRVGQCSFLFENPYKGKTMLVYKSAQYRDFLKTSLAQGLEPISERYYNSAYKGMADLFPNWWKESKIRKDVNKTILESMVKEKVSV